MKVLSIAPQPFFSPRGTPFSVYYRTSVMAEMGARIDLLTYGQGEDVDLPWVRIIRIPRFALLGPVKVGPSMLKLFLDGFVVMRTLMLLVRNRYDVVHAHEESSFFTRYLKPLFGFKMIYDMHSSLPQQLKNFSFTKSRLVIGTFERLEQTCLAHADAVITICPQLAEYAAPRMPDASRHFLIENSLFDEVRLKNRSTPSGSDRPWDRKIPRHRPIVSYAGTLESYQGIELLIAAFVEVQRSRPDAFLLVIGGSPAKVREFEELADRSGLGGHCLFTGQVDQSVARNLLTKADVLTSPRIKGTNTPLKIYEQLASGRPLVATRIVSHTQVLNDDVCFLTEPQPGPMAEALLEALTEGVSRTSKISAAKALYERDYSRRAYEQKIAALLKRLQS